MSEAAALEQTLKRLAEVGTVVKDRGYRQVWRFEHVGEAYYLKFYPRGTSTLAKLKRMLRGNPALREFTRLQWLQKAAVPAPRPVAALVGFKVGDVLGDAVILEAIEPSVQLDQYLNDLEQGGAPIADHHALAQHLRSLVYQLGRAKLGHSDLHLGNFLLHEQKLFLLDGYAVRKDGLRLSDVMLLGHSASRYATKTDLQRGWELLGPGGPMPRRNAAGNKRRQKFLSRIWGTQGSDYFGKLEIDGWTGVCFTRAKYPRRSSAVSKLEISQDDWRRAWPDLMQRIASDQLTILKRSASGEVLEGEIVLAGRPLQVIIKHPRRKFWWRYLTDLGRGPRPRRAWRKSWHLIVRGIPVAWPLLLMERKSMGYTTDALIVVEKVQGKTLGSLDLDAMDPRQRDMLFRRVGRVLRKLEDEGYGHFDAKSTNWIIVDDEKLGPTPVMVDVDGIRYHTWRDPGMRRLLRSMRAHKQYTPADSLALCQGYAPYARISPSAGTSGEGWDEGSLGIAN